MSSAKCSAIVSYAPRSSGLEVLFVHSSFYKSSARAAQPAAIRAGVLEVEDGKRYIDGEFVKRFGFHTLRHSLTSWLIANGGNSQIVRAMLRWTNFNMLAHYAHGFKSDKLEAQGAVLGRLVKSGMKSGMGTSGNE
jgi:integrase